MKKIVVRVFYVSVVGVPANKQKAYVEQVKAELLGVGQTTKTAAESTGTVFWEDLFIPLKIGDSRIEYMQIEIPSK